MPCENVTIPGTQEEASPLTVDNMNTQVSENQVVLSYTVVNPNSFEVFGQVKETFSLDETSGVDQEESFTATLTAGQRVDESVTFNTNFGIGEQADCEVCVEVSGTQRA